MIIDKPDVTDSRVKLRTISYGGGVQSTALCVLATQGRLDKIMGGPIDAAVFANVGDDSEHPDKIDYIRNTMIPWSIENGLRIVEVQAQLHGEPLTLLDKINDENSIPIPVRFSNGAFGQRTCTSKFKIETIHKWIRSQGISYKSTIGERNHRSKLTESQVNEIRSRYQNESISVRTLAKEYEVGKTQINDIINNKYWNAEEDSFAVVSIGISTDEIHRIKRKREEPHEIVAYPLIELGLDRDDCKAIIADAGLPVPPKSACFFCPFHKGDYWLNMKETRPELWEKTVEIEKRLNAKRVKKDKDPVYIGPPGIFLEDLVPEKGEEEVFNDGMCDEGVCWV
jgi:hypothetical protein